MYCVGQNHQRFVDVTKSSDVQAFNNMQYLHAHQNIYFSKPEDGEKVFQEFHAVSGNRPNDKVKLIEFAAVQNGQGFTKYERIEPSSEGKNVKEKLILYQTPKPFPTRWPSVLPFGLKKVAHSNGSGMGYVRRLEWLAGMKPQDDDVSVIQQSERSEPL
jgi:hypothetical protein